MENVATKTTTLVQTPAKVIAPDLSQTGIGVLLDMRCFLPLLTSIGFLGFLLFAAVSIIEMSFVWMLVCGWLSALTVCPRDLCAFPITCAKRAGGVWMPLGFVGGALAALVVPAAFTIAHYDHD